ncbi:GNAT family N-acetyltransferase [Leptothoe sp. ISB3NOV94-8A]
MESISIEEKAPVLVRVATCHDVSILTGLILLFRDFLKQDKPLREVLYKSIEIALSDTSIEFLLAISHNGNAVGYTQSRDYYSIWLSGIETKVEDVFVIQEYRGQGIGSNLLKSVIARSRKRGSKLLALNTNEKNSASLFLYRKHGLITNRSRWNGGKQLWLEREL